MSERQAVTALMQSLKVKKKKMRKYSKQFYANKPDNLEIMYKFLEK